MRRLRHRHLRDHRHGRPGRGGFFCSVVCACLLDKLSDEDIAHIACTLYDWSDETSRLTFSVAVFKEESPEIAQIKEMYRQMGETIHSRPLQVFQELVKPWQADELGYRTMEEWHGIEVAMSQEDMVHFGAGGGIHGVYLVK